MIKKFIAVIFAKLGIYIQFTSDPTHIADMRGMRPTSLIAGFVVGTKNHAMSVAIFGKKARFIYRMNNRINRLKSHFDNEYTIREWDVDVDGSYIVVKQLFRQEYELDFDSRSEFVLVWTRLDKDQLHEYVDGLFYGCSCEHDCCGHWFTNLWTHKTKKFGPLAVVFLGHGRNV